jgi:hypothetical protein
LLHIRYILSNYEDCVALSHMHFHS